MTMTAKTLLPAIGISIRAVGVSAHDGRIHKIMGTITARAAKHIEVKSPSGKNLSIAIAEWVGVEGDRRPAAVTKLTAQK